MRRTRQAVRAWETGDSMPGLLQLAELAEMYAISADEILFGPAPKRDLLWQVFARAGVPDPAVRVG